MILDHHPITVGSCGMHASACHKGYHNGTSGDACMEPWTESSIPESKKTSEMRAQDSEMDYMRHEEAHDKTSGNARMALLGAKVSLPTLSTAKRLLQSMPTT